MKLIQHTIGILQRFLWFLLYFLRSILCPLLPFFDCPGRHRLLGPHYTDEQSDTNDKDLKTNHKFYKLKEKIVETTHYQRAEVFLNLKTARQLRRHTEKLFSFKVDANIALFLSSKKNYTVLDYQFSNEATISIITLCLWQAKIKLIKKL